MATVATTPAVVSDNVVPAMMMEPPNSRSTKCMIMSPDSFQDMEGLDDMSKQLRREALEAIQLEPELSTLLYRTVLAPNVVTFEDAVAMTVCYRLLLHPQPTTNPQCPTTVSNNTNNNSAAGPMFCPNSLLQILRTSMASSELEHGHTMKEAIREDALAVCRRDPAFETLLEVVLFSKGYSALVCHRAARRKWYQTLNGGSKGKQQHRSFTALFLQSQASAVFGLDIHPAATLGKGIMLDHGTGVVIGETAYAGDGCTFLHGVTLGGTGKDTGDRHPKVGKNVLIGAGASILGNIALGDGCKIGAGSVVLRPIPAGATAVGSPARIIGHAKESNPGSDMDEILENVSMLHRSESSATVSTSKSMTSLLSSSTTSTTPDEQQLLHRSSTSSKSTNSTTTSSSPQPIDENSSSEFMIGDDDNSSGHDATDSDKDNDGDAEEEEEDQEAVPNDNDNNGGGDGGDGVNQPSKKKESIPIKKVSKKKKKPRRHSSDGTTTTTSSADVNNNYCCCPFRDYTRLAKSAPAGSVTIVHLRKLLRPEGCSELEIGQVFFHLDTKDVGYFYPQDNHERCLEAITMYTKLSKERAQEIIQSKNCSTTTSACQGGATTTNTNTTTKSKRRIKVKSAPSEPFGD